MQGRPRSPPLTPKKTKFAVTKRTKKRGAPSIKAKRPVKVLRSSGGKKGEQLVSASSQKGFSARRKGHKKPVKVSRALRKKILKVLETDAAIGKYLSIYYYSIVPGVPFQVTPVQDQNSFEFMGIVSTEGGARENRLLFSPQWVRYAVSRLCGQKSKELAVHWAHLDTNNTLNARIAKVKVLKQSATYRMRNNTGRTVTVRITCWSPKSVDTQYPEGVTPYDAWNSVLVNQNTPAFQNPTGATPFTLYNSPKYLPELKARYNMDETIVDIPAGREYIYKVDGPEMVYDYSKYWKESKFYDMQKFTKQVTVAVCNDLVKTSLNGFGRYTDMVTGAASGGVVIEQTCYVKFAVPEQVGFIYGSPSPGDNQPLNQKRYVFGIDNFQETSQVGTVQYIGDENPIGFETANV